VALRRRIGFEIELLAPRGSDRRALAERLAKACGGEAAPVWHSDSEPAPVPHLGGRFLTLTLGYEVREAGGELLCTLVDDITISAQLDATAPASPGWHRLLTDEPRLLRLMAQVCAPTAPLETVLDRLGELWGEVPERIGAVWRVESQGATIALAAPAGSERERVCEIVTAPISADHAAALERLLAVARDLEFTVPAEAAVHLHFDGAPFREPGALANVVRLFGYWREQLRTTLATNPRCQRLAPLPDELMQVVDGRPTYDELREAARRGELSKFFDVNLTQLLRDHPIRDTLEVRILPGALHADDVVAGAELVERLLDRCLDPHPIPRPASPAQPVESLLGESADGDGE
jgi:hypothetical protein